MVIWNDIIPFDGYKAMNLFGIIFVRNGCKFDEVDINHEEIHGAQIRELAFIPFYIIYAIEYLYKRLKYGKHKTAYRNISFEKEAYANEENLDYLKTRKHYAQWRKKKDDSKTVA